jgi:ferredoxin
MMHVRRPPRLLIRLAFLSAAVACLWPLTVLRNISETAVQASPFVSCCSLLAGRPLKAGMAAGLVFALIVLFRKRWFCRYSCPTGFLLDGAARAGCLKNGWWKRCPPIGRYIVFLTVAGAVAGYPLFLWADPLAIFSSALSIHTSLSFSSAVLAAACMIALLMVAFLFGDLWCARICPLGAAQELLNGIKGLILKGKELLKPQSRETTFTVSSAHATRRAFLSVAAGVGIGFLAKRTGRAHNETAPLRPPGAVAEEMFAGLCIRCGNCIRSCPSKILDADTGRAGVLGLLAPVVRFKSGYCLEDCNACTQICPSGALETLSMDQKCRYIIGEALVDGSLCLLVRGVNDCDICARSCPFDAVTIYWDEERYVAYPNIDPGKCNGCGACEAYCPTGDIKAIRVWKVT